MVIITGFVMHLYLLPVGATIVSYGLSFTQTTQDVISGFEAAWEFFDGVFPVVVWTFASLGVDCGMREI